MIIGFVGKMGMGKTLSMTMFAYRKYMAGVKVVANYNLHFPHEKLDYMKIKHLDQEYSDMVVLIDEAHTFLDSRASMKSHARYTSYWIVMGRKQGRDVYYTTQRWGQVDVRLRNNTDYVVVCKSKKINSKTFIKLLISDLDGRERRIRVQADPYFGLYDTKQIINPFEDTDFEPKQRKKPKSGSEYESDSETAVY